MLRPVAFIACSLAIAWSVCLLTLAMVGAVLRLAGDVHLPGRGRAFMAMDIWLIFSLSEASTSGDPDENSGTNQQNENNDIAGCEHDMNLSRVSNGAVQIAGCQMTTRRGHGRQDPYGCNKVLPRHLDDAGSSGDVAMERLDQQDDGAVMQDLVRDARRGVDEPGGGEITLRRRELRYASCQSNAGKETAWLMTLAGLRIPPAIRSILDVVIRCASPGNGFIP